MSKAIIKCHDCGSSQEYDTKDLLSEGREDDWQVYVNCKACETMTGEQKAIEKLLEDYPEYDYDPDRDYDRLSDEKAEKENTT